MHKSISDYTSGREDLWIIGDLFASNSVERYLKEACNTTIKGKIDTGTHSGDYFKIKVFTSNQYSGQIRNTIGRIRNTIARAFNSQQALPKVIVIVLDDDIINFVPVDEFGVSIIYGRIIHYLFAECKKLLALKRERLPKKALVETHLIWIAPPFHNGFSNSNLHAKFSRNLDNIANLFEGMWSLKLKKIWDPADFNLYLQDAKRFTAMGLMSYWMAVERAIRFWDTVLKENKMKQLRCQPNPPQHSHKIQKGRFHGKYKKLRFS